MRGCKHCRVNGNADGQDRKSAIDDFNRENSEKFCFISSARAGGLCINLQTADACILHDSDWNPQKLNACLLEYQKHFSPLNSHKKFT